MNHNIKKVYNKVSNNVYNNKIIYNNKNVYENKNIYNNNNKIYTIK